MSRLERLGLALGDAAQPSVRMNRSVLSPGGAGDLRQPPASRSAGRGPPARGDPARGRSPGRTRGRASVSARMCGTPQRSREISTGPSMPGSRRSPVVRGSGRRNSWYQRPGGRASREPPERRARERCAFSHCPNVHAATLGNHHDCRVCGGVSLLIRQPGGVGRAGLVVNAVREPALGVELLQMRLHHQRGGRAELAVGRRPKPRRAADRGSAPRHRERRPACARDRGGGRCTR